MAHITKKSLQAQLDNQILGNSVTKRTGKAANASLVDSLYTTEIASGLTISESGVVTLQTTQPANSYIEDIAVVCTANAAFDSAELGIRVGTAEGGAQIVNVDYSSSLEPGSSDATTAGIGTSTVAKTQVALQGNKALDLVAGQAYSATERVIYTQVSASTGAFTTNTGEFTAAVTYVKL